MEELTTVLLRESSSPQELGHAAAALYDLLDSISPNLPNTPASRLSSGAALGPRDAAACTKDPLRTAVFLRGLNAAIDESRKRFRDRRIEIVYAGTGPYESALSDEPQVAIYRHLAAQLHPRGVMVPQRIVVDFEISEAPVLALSDRRYRTRVGEVFQLSLRASAARTLQLTTASRNATGMYVTHIQAYGRHDWRRANPVSRKQKSFGISQTSRPAKKSSSDTS